MRKFYTLLTFVAMATTIFAQVAPTFSTGAGTYYNPFSIELSGSEIYYTLDGTAPTKNSTKYTGAISIDEFGTSTTIKAASCVNDTWSEVVTATYELKVAAPEFSVKSGVYEKLTNTDALKLTTATTGATIHYNDRGQSAITSGSKLYGSLSILSTKSVNAVAFVTDTKGNKIYSDIASEYYVISPIALYYSANEVT
ncbi:MAG: chitobiase/beta-hexosaminidase C-terminal domain-containing protein, partial [Bacteroidaceae bacterium]|nr:chitobiase/beta-hexosaminidase C-terminal domain-containing protein [Bacteroidaceae bacterium]